jgi:selenocysteine lyase/cysteine desulfurase
MFDKSADAFPVKREYIFLSHCSISPLYGAALQREREMAEAQCRGGVVVYSQYDAILDGLRTASAALLHTAPENLAFVKNTSEGINILANGYRFEPGDEVISYVHEYPANHYPWKLQERRGVKLVLLPDAEPHGPRPTSWSMQALEAAVTPRTRIVALSHVQFASGYAADLSALAHFCKSRGIDLILDAAQSLGCLPIDADALGLAAVVSSGWKWLMGPIGTGVFFTSKALRDKLDLTLVGAETMQQGTDYLDHTWAPVSTARAFEYSTSPIALAAALETCIRELPLRYGLKAIEAELYRLQDVFLDRIKSSSVRPAFLPPQRTPILSLNVPGDVNALRRELFKQKVITTERGGYLRIAPHIHNTDAEMERAAEWIVQFT